MHRLLQLPPSFFLGLLLASPALGQEAGGDRLARAVVEKADEIRFPRQGFQVDATVTTTAPNRAAEVRQYQILSKGNDNTLVMVTAPAIDRGQILLMKGRDLWIFIPNVSQPVRLPLSQRLTGQVANGDLARVNFSGDYAPRLLGVQEIDRQTYYQLELKAVDRSVTYHRVLYWVNKDDYRPHKAEFYTVSGRLLKTCFYTGFRSMGGRVRPSRLIMHDALAGGEKSVLDYDGLLLRELPDKVFTKEYLKKLIAG